MLENTTAFRQNWDKPFADWFAFSFSKCSMEEYSMLVTSENDWLDRLGSFCDYDGRSDKVLHIMGITTVEARALGWNNYMQYLIHDTTNISKNAQIFGISRE